MPWSGGTFATPGPASTAAGGIGGRARGHAKTQRAQTQAAWCPRNRSWISRWCWDPLRPRPVVRSIAGRFCLTPRRNPRIVLFDSRSRRLRHFSSAPRGAKPRGVFLSPRRRDGVRPGGKSPGRIDAISGWTEWRQLCLIQWGQVAPPSAGGDRRGSRRGRRSPPVQAAGPSRRNPAGGQAARPL